MSSMISESVWLEFTEILVPVLAWAVVWALAFAASLQGLTPASLSADDRSYWASCVVGSIHAAYTGYQALALLDLPFWPGVISIWDDFGARHIEWELVLLVSLGFFVFDFALTLCSPGMQGQKLVAVHHLLTLGIHSSIPRYGMFAALSAMGYLAELSTPLVNGRWMLSVTTGTGDAVYLANGIAMMVIFFFCRIVAGAFYLYEMFVLVPRHAPPLLSDMGIQGRVIPPLTLAFYALNIYWMYKIVKGALKALGLTSSKKSD